MNKHRHYESKRQKHTDNDLDNKTELVFKCFQDNETRAHRKRKVQQNQKKKGNK